MASKIRCGGTTFTGFTTRRMSSAEIRGKRTCSNAVVTRGSTTTKRQHLLNNLLQKVAGAGSRVRRWMRGGGGSNDRCHLLHSAEEPATPKGSPIHRGEAIQHHPRHHRRTWLDMTTRPEDRLVPVKDLSPRRSQGTHNQAPATCKEASTCGRDSHTGHRHVRCGIVAAPSRRSGRH